MRFAAVAAFFAAAAMAGSTVYETEVKTITSCGPEVPDCPAATSTAYPVDETEYPEMPTETEIPEPATTLVPTHGYGNDSSPYMPEEEECPGYSVKTISTSITTVIPTVIYETVDIPCETEAPTTAYYPTGTGGYASASTAYPTTTGTFTAGASNVAVSMIAVAAGFIALMA